MRDVQCDILMTNEPLYCKAAFRVLAIGDDSVAVTGASSGRAVVLERETFRVLQAAAHFKTVASHAAAYQTAIRGKPDESAVEDTVRRLRQLIDLDLLVSDSEILKPATAARAQRRISTIGLVTKNRPLAVRRCLDRIFKQLDTHSRYAAVRIYDDSTNSDTEELIASQCEKAASPFVTLYYSARKHKASFVSSLESATGIAKDLLTFAFNDLHLCGPTFGANLNNLLADTFGELILTIDDDVLCDPGAASPESKKVALSSEYDPTKMRLFKDSDEAVRSVTWMDADVLALHEQVLGRSLSDCLGSAPEVDLSGAQLASNLFVQPEKANVSVSMFGIVGDPGTHVTSWFHLAERYPKLVETDETYLAIRETRNVLRSVPYTTISENRFFMNTFAGLDNSVLLPPFLPVFRNMDGVFGGALRSCATESAIAYLPYVALHAPLAEYKVTRPQPANLYPRLSEILLQVIATATIGAWYEMPAERLAVLGRMLIDIGALGDKAFSAWLSSQCQLYWGTQIIWRHRLLKIAKSAGSAWKQEIAEHLSQLQSLMEGSGPGTIADLVQSGSQLELEHMTRLLIRQFGQLLASWPVIREACEFLHGKGIYVSERVRRQNRVSAAV
jgi:hypothetical protein